MGSFSGEPLPLAEMSIFVIIRGWLREPMTGTIFLFFHRATNAGGLVGVGF